MRSLASKPVVAVVVVALVAYTLPPCWAQEENGTAAEERDYGQREAGSKGLEEFTGGLHVVVFAVVVVATLVAIVGYAVWVDAHCYCREHHIYHHHHEYRETPRPEPKP